MTLLRLFFASLLIAGLLCLPVTAAPPPMRPYSGIGAVIIADAPQADALPLYEEPGLFRIGEFNRAKLTGNEWVTGRQTDSVLLIVMTRKGEWLKVVYDDAGREAWILPGRNGRFQPWDEFLKTQLCHLLPGLRKPLYQLYRQANKEPLLALTPKQLFKTLRVENDWAMVMVDQSSIGWLRWRDEDGRLLVGLEH